MGGFWFSLDWRLLGFSPVLCAALDYCPWRPQQRGLSFPSAHKAVENKALVCQSRQSDHANSHSRLGTAFPGSDGCIFEPVTRVLVEFGQGINPIESRWRDSIPCAQIDNPAAIVLSHHVPLLRQGGTAADAINNRVSPSVLRFSSLELLRATNTLFLRPGSS